MINTLKSFLKSRNLNVTFFVPCCLLHVSPWEFIFPDGNGCVCSEREKNHIFFITLGAAGGISPACFPHISIKQPKTSETQLLSDVLTLSCATLTLDCCSH